MLFHFTLIKVMPDKVQQAAEILAGSRLLEYFLQTKGLLHGSLSESLDEAGKLLSLSMWDSPADAQAVFADPNYGALVGELRNLLAAPPLRIGYNMLQSQIIQALPGEKNLFIHNTIVTVAPENTQKLLSGLYNEKMISLAETFAGFIMSYALESMEEPGRIVSMSWWTSSAQALATFARPEYGTLVGNLSQYFIKAPERQGYQVLRIVKNEQ